jgi:hypothetical protein
MAKTLSENDHVKHQNALLKKLEGFANGDLAVLDTNIEAPKTSEETEATQKI